jgi:Zn-dependent protease
MFLIDIIIVLEAFLWLLSICIPLLMLLVIISCLVRNRLHHQRQKMMEKTVANLFNHYCETGAWPTPRNKEEQLALETLSKRMDINETFRELK